MAIPLQELFCGYSSSVKKINYSQIVEIKYHSKIYSLYQYT